MRIYDTDPEVFARTTKIKFIRTLDAINGLLAQYTIIDVFWHNNLKNNDVYNKIIIYGI